MAEKNSEVEILKETIKSKSEDYAALRDGKYFVRDGHKEEVFSIYEWHREYKSSSTRHGHLVAVCYDRREAIAVRDGLRRINEDSTIEYEASSNGPSGDEYHRV